MKTLEEVQQAFTDRFNSIKTQRDNILKSHNEGKVNYTDYADIDGMLSYGQSQIRKLAKDIFLDATFLYKE